VGEISESGRCNVGDKADGKDMQIGRRDVLWNYAATFLKIAAAGILLPFILRFLPQETTAIWTIFSTIIAFVGLLDFGFNPSFMRNVSYVFSGAKALKREGYNIVDENDSEIDYGLLKGLINSMRWFYARVAVILFILLTTLGTYYLRAVLESYPGNIPEVYISWMILCVINTYYLYTLYYDSLLQGRGLVKRAKQITVIGQFTYLVTGIVLIFMHCGLVAIVSAQALSILIIRIMSYRSFYDPWLKHRLGNAKAQSQKDILSAVYPNAIKIGLTSFGGFLVNRSALIAGSLYITLAGIASYGITMQIIGVISAVSTVYITTYQPQIVQYRIQNNTVAIKNIFIKGNIFMITTYLILGTVFVLCGSWALDIIGSQTPLLSAGLITVALVISLLETNHGTAGNILLTKNKVPFFKAALFSGGFTLVLLLLFLRCTSLGIFGMILAPGIAQACYQNWKWPLEVVKELGIGKNDTGMVMNDLKDKLFFKLFRVPNRFQK
jgi:O-antigen/teichoic acid export membrane protein